MLLVYTQKVTPRIIYIFKHICTNMLGIEIKFTSKIEEFVAHDGFKMSYGKQPLGNEFFIQNTDLLLEHGFEELEIKVQPWGNTVCFFPVSDHSNLPFDIFAASFYLLTRYEEYLPHVKDEAGRFPVSESLAYKESFLKTPVVDIWAYKFKEVLKEKFPEMLFNTTNFRAETIFAIEHGFVFSNKGVIRSMVGWGNDLVKLHFHRFVDRVKSWMKVKRDPYDIFDELVQLVKKHSLSTIFMFKVADFTLYDRNINYNRMPYRSNIKYVSDYAKIGLLLGHYSSQVIKTLRVEKVRLENIIHYPLENVLNASYDLGIPEHFNTLAELEFENDYSMGYPDDLGFRAGTCSSFLFYDINMEITSPLQIHPYIFNSNVGKKYSSEELKKEISKIHERVKSVGGTFRTIFKNEDFSEYYNSNRYYSLLKQIHEIE
ncbi:polysaccharide deacetylase family protein [Zunongwangia sp. HRR-M8]|uniref:polysaccharide deacetylase family protein n=1 Tax=Zunongwangia sp. HRR-M8 TaxID=3015170 RepID=UPI0022DE84CE|nr:polysaccharide deacetylase family protein [Zunongwangia sp. HRR-M8]WBL21881.1 polysaccharide deacetylase family protein [Zunongwangia sp. HRR-M8]